MIYTDVYINSASKTDLDIYVYINEVPNLIAKTDLDICVYK